MKKTLILVAFLATSFTANAQSLSKSLQAKMDYLIQRQNVISGNIANAATPNYLAKDLVYKPRSSKKTSSSMLVTNSKHMMPTGFKSQHETTFNKTFIRNDGNSVRLDDQMLKMAQIQQEYTMATRIFSKHLNMQKLVVKNQ